MIRKSRPSRRDESNIEHSRSNNTRPSRGAATECSPQRELWLVVKKCDHAPKGRKKANDADAQMPMTPPITTERDPVCGMNVNPATAKHVHEHAGKKYYFCCAGCVEKFKADPQTYLNKPAASGLVTLGMPSAASPLSSRAEPPFREREREAQSRTGSVPASASYVCPMCPEVREVQARSLPLLRHGA